MLTEQVERANRCNGCNARLILSCCTLNKSHFSLKDDNKSYAWFDFDYFEMTLYV